MFLLYSRSFKCTLVGGPRDYNHMFEDATDFDESGVLLFLRPSVHAFISYVGLFSVLLGSLLDFLEPNLAYYCGREVDRGEVAYVVGFRYVGLTSNVLNICTHEIAKGK